MAIHAGLECGLIGAVYPDLDMASLGPTIRGPHSPDERVKIDTVGMFYDWLLEILKEALDKSRSKKQILHVRSPLRGDFQ